MEEIDNFGLDLTLFKTEDDRRSEVVSEAPRKLTIFHASLFVYTNST